jgi:cell division protein FtsI (penicillin-binding protein 3)
LKRGADDNARGFRLRAGLAFALLVLAAGGLLSRAVYLQLLRNEYLTEQGDARFMRVVRTPAIRGTIFDRDGQPLAVSTPEDSACADPQKLATVPDQLDGLARVLGTSPDHLKQAAT